MNALRFLKQKLNIDSPQCDIDMYHIMRYAIEEQIFHHQLKLQAQMIVISTEDLRRTSRYKRFTYTSEYPLFGDLRIPMECLGKVNIEFEPDELLSQCEFSPHFEIKCTHIVNALKLPNMKHLWNKIIIHPSCYCNSSHVCNYVQYLKLFLPMCFYMWHIAMKNGMFCK